MEDKLPITHEECALIARRAAMSVTRGKTINGSDLGDFIQEALIGIYKAAGRYNGEKSSFATWAFNKARWYLKDYLRSIDWVPRVERTRLKNLGIPARYQTSLYALDSNSREWVETIPASKPKRDFGYEIEQLLNKSGDPVGRQILEMYYLRGLSIKAIGERLGLSESRISQIHTRTIHNIQAAMGIEDDMSKQQQVREIMNELGEQATWEAVQEVLQQRGITCSKGTYDIVKKMRRAPASAVAAAPSQDSQRPASFSVHDLKEILGFAEAVGGLDRLIEVCAFLKEVKSI